METVLHALAACRDLLGGGIVALPASLFLFGVLASPLHCGGMCGPFVLGQVAADARATAGAGEWRRLAGAALLPYHAGRLVTYAGLGALAGALAQPLDRWAEGALASAALLFLGAILMLAQALGLALPGASAGAGPLARLARPFATARTSGHRLALGLLLGFLPCGLVYAALAVAAGSGSATGGAVVMAAFGAGTVPALVAVGWGGALLGRRWRDGARRIAAPLIAANALIVLALAAARLTS